MYSRNVKIPKDEENRSIAYTLDGQLLVPSNIPLGEWEIKRRTTSKLLFDNEEKTLEQFDLLDGVNHQNIIKLECTLTELKTVLVVKPFGVKLTEKIKNSYHEFWKYNSSGQVVGISSDCCSFLIKLLDVTHYLVTRSLSIQSIDLLDNIAFKNDDLKFPVVIMLMRDPEAKGWNMMGELIDKIHTQRLPELQHFRNELSRPYEPTKDKKTTLLEHPVLQSGEEKKESIFKFRKMWKEGTVKVGYFRKNNQFFFDDWKDKVNAMPEDFNKSLNEFKYLNNLDGFLKWARDLCMHINEEGHQRVRTAPYEDVELTDEIEKAFPTLFIEIFSYMNSQDQLRLSK